MTTQDWALVGLAGFSGILLALHVFPPRRIGLGLMAMWELDRWRKGDNVTAGNLRKCPFCGSQAHLGNYMSDYWVTCEGCPAELGYHTTLDGEPSGAFSSEADAVKAWNRRTKPWMH